MRLKHPDVQVKPPSVQKETPTSTKVVQETPPSPSLSDPFLANRIAIDLSKAIPLQVGSGTPQSTSSSEQNPPSESTLQPKGGIEGSKGVEQQKKTVESTPPIPPQVYILPVPETLLQSGHRDQPRMVVVDESKGGEREPVISTEGLRGGLPAEVTTHQVELSTAAPKIALSHKTFLLYDYARGVGFKGSLAEFIEQTIEDYFAERKIRVTVSREA